MGLNDGDNLRTEKPSDSRQFRIGGRSRSNGGGKGPSDVSEENPSENATNTGSYDKSELESLKRFIALCKGLSGQALSASILRFPNEWKKCFELADKLPTYRVHDLVTILAKLSVACSVPHPAIHHCKTTLSDLVIKAKESEKLRAAEMVWNAVDRLLKFEWTCSKDEVKVELECILDTMVSSLSFKNTEHRPLLKKIQNLMEELEGNAPWIIRTTGLSVAHLVEENDNQDILTKWRHATVSWLTDGENFIPPELPKMRIPGDKHGGVFDSVEHYFDTIQRLWIGITWSDGWRVLNPYCKANNDQKECGRSLWPLEGSHMSCKRKGCTRTVNFACPNFRHNFGVCTDCAKKTRNELMGPPGPRASTDIYDGTITKVNWDGKVFITNVKSRKPPMRDIHWGSTRRLNCAGLVGIILITACRVGLSPSSKIIWGEIVSHERGSKNYEEMRKRADGKLAVAMLDMGEQQEILLEEGNHVCIIDCATFVPEFIPVLKALEIQKKRPLPFDNGKLINIQPSERHGKVILEDDDSAMIDLWFAKGFPAKGVVTNLVSNLIHHSVLEPLVQLRYEI
jgi:hypothetical protein